MREGFPIRHPGDAPLHRIAPALCRIALKNGKSPGQDNLNAELFKAEPELAAQVLQPLFTTIWEEKQLPDGWTHGGCHREDSEERSPEQL